MIAQKAGNAKARTQVADAGTKPSKAPVKAPAAPGAKPPPDLTRVRVALAQIKEMPAQKPAKR